MKDDKMPCLLQFFFTKRYMFISIVPNIHTKFVMYILKIKIEELMKAMKVTEIMN